MLSKWLPSLGQWSPLTWLISLTSFLGQEHILSSSPVSGLRDKTRSLTFGALSRGLLQLKSELSWWSEVPQALMVHPASPAGQGTPLNLLGRLLSLTINPVSGMSGPGDPIVDHGSCDSSLPSVTL